MFKDIIITLTASILLSSTAYAVDGNQLLQQIDRNLAPESYELYRKLINIEPDGRKKEFVLYQQWKIFLGLLKSQIKFFHSNEKEYFDWCHCRDCHFGIIHLC